MPRRWPPTDRGEQLELPAELTDPILAHTIPTFFDRPKEDDGARPDRP